MLMGVSSQKISVRLKRTVTHKATQTEALSWPGSEGPSSHFVLSSPRRTEASLSVPGAGTQHMLST